MKISALKQSLLSYEEARKLLRYDAERGLLFWKVDRRRRRAGDIAGSVAPTTGRMVITINGRNYLQARVAWLLHYGVWPRELVDHKNRDLRDGRISNLRLADAVQNGGNRIGGKRRLKGSMKGASLSIRPGRATVWRSSIKIKGKTKNLGAYASELEAHQAYCRAAAVAFGPFARAA